MSPPDVIAHDCGLALAAVTKCHRLGDLDFSQFWGWKSQVRVLGVISFLVEARFLA